MVSRNGSESVYYIVDRNTSSHLTNSTTKMANIAWDNGTRISVLWIQIILGTVGGLVVCGWLWCNHRRKSRVNVILLHVTLSDLLVMAAALIQVTWEMVDRQWLAGEAMCRIIKFYQSFAMMASSNMMVLLSIDRHQAIRSPLRNPPAVWKHALPFWLVAGVLSSPMFFMYRVRFVEEETSMFYNKTICESLLYAKPPVFSKVFLTSVSFIHIYIPCVIIAVCYVRMFMKIAEKANMTGSSKSSTKSGKVHLQSTKSTSLPKAKIKTLKMTIVIVTTFILCGLPYHTMNLISNFLGPDYVSPLAAAILGALPVANSVVNPYIFLAFSTNCRCLRSVRPQERRSYMSTQKDDTLTTHMTDTRMSTVSTVTYNDPSRDATPNGNVQNRNMYVPMTSMDQPCIC